MDEFKIQSLIAQNKVANLDQVDPDNTYIQVGIYQRGNQKRRSGNANVYPPAAMALSELIPVIRASDIYVDANFGDDTTAEVNNILKPFLNIRTAISASFSLYKPTIYVRGGVYYETKIQLFANMNVTIHFENGCVVNGLGLELNGFEYGKINLNITGNAIFQNCYIISLGGINFNFEFDQLLVDLNNNFYDNLAPYGILFNSTLGENNILFKGNSIKLIGRTDPIYERFAHLIDWTDVYGIGLGKGTNYTLQLAKELVSFNSPALSLLNYQHPTVSNPGNITITTPKIQTNDAASTVKIFTPLGNLSDLYITINSNIILKTMSLINNDFQSVIFYRGCNLTVNGNIHASSRGAGIFAYGDNNVGGYLKVYGDVISSNDEAIISNTTYAPIYVQDGLISGGSTNGGLYSKTTIAMGEGPDSTGNAAKAFFKNCRIIYNGVASVGPDQVSVVNLTGNNANNHVIYAYDCEFGYANALPAEETCIATAARTPGFVNCTASNANNVNITDLFVPSGFTVVPLLTIPNF